MSAILPAAELRADAAIDVAVIGAGACGLVAAMRAAEAGADVLVLERDAKPSGSTSMSSGFIPAPATRFQRAIGIDDDTPDRFAADIQSKTKNRADVGLVETVSSAIGPALEWLGDSHGLEWIVLDDFLYPKHSRHRMHAVPEKTGAALLQRLATAADGAGVSPLHCFFKQRDGNVDAHVFERLRNFMRAVVQPLEIPFDERDFAGGCILFGPIRRDDDIAAIEFRDCLNRLEAPSKNGDIALFGICCSHTISQPGPREAVILI